MLNKFEISDLMQFQESLPESREKELLNRLLLEYGQYTQCGTVEDCKQRMDWMSLSLDDIRNNFNSFVKEMREEVEIIRRTESDNQEKRKKGRPRKE